MRENIRLDLNDVDAHNNLGILLKALKRYDEAEKEYREAIRIKPNDVVAHYNLGNLLIHSKRNREVKQEIWRAKGLFEKQGRIKHVKLCDEILKKLSI